MKISWSKQSLLLILLLTTTLCILFYYGKKTVVDIPRQAYLSSERIIEDQQDLLNKVESIDGSEDSLSKQLAELNNSIPNNIDPSTWMDEIKHIADANQVTIQLLNSMETTVNSEAESTIDSIDSNNFQLDLIYDDRTALESFIEDVYQMTQITDISSLSYEQTESNTGTLFLRTYTQPSNLE
ncbi:hypothetical protein [Marinilactibacillus sp. Marseille-P9653]|uniref:hypothetical protein n=1 Tax=Marinilactibacillus sp. Marseille-P9653 TaxID=2866583 RepID=UPI001CE3D64F|nr:hypothetical protein [Marinilactibacillus sp. Marseille-P9653]